MVNVKYHDHQIRSELQHFLQLLSECDETQNLNETKSKTFFGNHFFQLQISHYIKAKFVHTKKKNMKKCQHFLECLQRILPKRDKGSFGKI